MTPPRPPHPPRRPPGDDAPDGSADRDRRRRGGVLAEFALLAFVIWLMLAGVLELGRALAAQQLLQHAARTLARELARLELPADLDFEAALASPAARAEVLDPRFLVIDSDLLRRCGRADFGEAAHAADLDALFAGLPIGNRLLRPLMIADRREGLRMIRYPGALLRRTGVAPSSCADGSEFTIGIAWLDEAAGAVRWRGVVEEDTAALDAAAERDGFALADGGWVGLRLHYPFQSAGLLQARGTGVVDPTTGRETQTLVDADAPLTDLGLAALGAELLTAGDDGTPAAYRGPRGLGRLYSLPDASGVARAVRPFRRVLSASAGFRREIFGAPLAAAGGL